VVFGHRLDLVPQLVLPDLRLIRQAIVAGLGFMILCWTGMATGLGWLRRDRASYTIKNILY
jgi:hypothetical protein